MFRNFEKPFFIGKITTHKKPMQKYHGLVQMFPFFIGEVKKN